jgi:hypothetical protein
MRKVLLLLLAAVLSVSCVYASGTTSVSPQSVTPTSSFGIGFDANTGVFNGNGNGGPVMVSFAGASINGFSLIFLDKDRNGFSIPVSLNFSSANNPNSNGGTSVSSANSLTITAGFYPIRSIFKNNSVRLSFIYGFSLLYSCFLHGYIPEDYATLNSVCGISLSAGLQLEVPIGGILTLPKDSLCLVSGVNLSGSALYSEHFNGRNFVSDQHSFSFGSFSTGGSISNIGIRYYF